MDFQFFHGHSVLSCICTEKEKERAVPFKRVTLKLSCVIKSNYLSHIGSLRTINHQEGLYRFLYNQALRN